MKKKYDEDQLQTLAAESFFSVWNGFLYLVPIIVDETIKACLAKFPKSRLRKFGPRTGLLLGPIVGRAEAVARKKKIKPGVRNNAVRRNAVSRR